LTEDECDAYVIVSSARLGDREATHDLPVAPIRALTEKETATLVLMSVGIDNKEIAVRLGIGVESVKSRVRQIIRKLSAHDRTHAVAIGLRRGLIE
jgi:DNA-binding NarL/FixJ family response regulator